MKHAAREMTRRGATCAAVSIALMVAVMGAPRGAAGSATGDMEAAAATFAEAERRRTKDPQAAIALYERGLAEVPEEPGYAPARVDALLEIVDLLEAVFRDDGDIERLYHARELLDRYLGPLELLDEQGRAAAEERRAGLLGQIAAVEARLRAEAVAREAAAARRRGRTLTSAGIGTLGGAAVGFGVMGLGMSGGRQTDRLIEAEIEANGWDEPCPAFSDESCERRRMALEKLVETGSRRNAQALAGALAGGVLTLVGAALILVGRRSVRRAKEIELTPTAAGAGMSLGVGLRGRF